MKLNQIIDELLDRNSIQYEELRPDERSTIDQWSSSLNNNTLSIDSIKNHIKRMKYSVENELTETTHNKDQDLFLKARLRNYLLLEALLESPDKVKQQMEKALSNITRKGFK